MFYRITFYLFISCFVHIAWAGQGSTKKDPTQTVFDLERSVAILQVSSASVDDVQALQKQIDQLEAKQATSDRVDFLSNVVFLLSVVVLILVWRLWFISKRLARNVSENSSITK